MAVMTLEEFKKKKKDTEEAPRSSVMTLEEYKKATNYEPEIDDALFKNKSTLGNASSGTTKYNKLPTYNKTSNGTNKYNKMEITKLPVKNNFQSQFNTQNNVTKTSGFNNKLQSENLLTNNVWYQKQQKEKTQKENRIKQLEKQLPDLQKKLNTSVYSDSKKAEWQQEYNKLQKEYDSLTKDTNIDLGKMGITGLNLLKIGGKHLIKGAQNLFVNPLVQFSSSEYNPVMWIQTGQTPWSKDKSKLKELQSTANEVIGTDASEIIMDNLGYNKEYKDGLTIDEWLEKNSYLKEDSFGGKLIGTTFEQIPNYLIGGVAGPKASIGSLGVSSYGNSIEEAYQNGATREQANKYGLMNAGIEIGTEKMFPSVNGLYGKPGLKNAIKEINEEGLEEVTSDLLNPLAKKLSYENDKDLKELYKDTNLKSLGESYLLGGASAGLMKGTEYITNKSSNIETNITNKSKAQTTENTKLPVAKEENLPKINKNYNTLEENNTQINENKANIQELPTKTINNTNLQEINQNREQNKQIAPIKTIENNNEIENTIQNTTETNNNNENIVENLKKIRENTTNKAEQVKLDNHIQQIENDIKGLSNDSKSFAQDNKTVKQQQFDIISDTNPMLDDYHTGIRNVNDIKTFKEAFFEDGEYSGMDPDFTESMARKALDNGKITVYSSYPIKNGVFVSPSVMEAQQYAGGDASKLYSKEVNINDVAWIDGAEGQYAKLKDNVPSNIKNNVVLAPTNKIMEKYEGGGKRSNAEMQILKNDILENGIENPIVISKETGKIVDGNHRLLAAKELGIDNVPVLYVDSANDIDFNNNKWYDTLQRSMNGNATNKTRINKTNGRIQNESINKNRSSEINNNRRGNEKSNTIYKKAQTDNKRSSTKTVYSTDTTMGKELKNSSFSNEKIAPVKETKNSNLPLIKLDTAVKQIKYNQADYKQIADTINSKSNTNPRSWLETSMESKSLKEYQPELIKGLKDENLTYEVQSNKSTLEKANKKLSSMSYENAVSYIEGKIYDEKNMTLTDVALTERLIQEASKKGDYQTASDLIQDLAIMGTDMGQKVQALSMIKRLTPEGQLSMYQKIVNRAKARGEYAFNDVEITPEMVKTILDAYDQNGHYDQADLNERVEKFKQQVSEQLKSTAGDKLNSWRYLSMLGNPKTHIRNIVSNVAMKGTLKVKNSVARTLETVLPVKQENRTKTWKMATKEVKNYAKQTAIDMKDTITGENKYNEKTQLEANKKIFKNKLLEGVSNFNSNALEFEDWLFSKSAFQKTFQEYLTAQGIKTQQDIENNPKIIEKGKQYAVEQAEIATFRQYSKLASKIAEIERHNKGAKFAIEALVPFKKTPINVAKAGVNYSPLGLTKSVFYDSIQLKKGNINGSQFIDNLSQGMTGTSLALLGYMLAKSGILSGSGDDDKEGKYDNQLGHQNYALNLGGNSYSISWLSPVAMPLLVGANSYEKLEKQEGWDANVVIDTLASTLDPLSSMSFVSGLTDTLNSYSKGSSNMIKDIGLNTLESYILQYVPTLSSQFASVTDDKKRSTKASNNSKFKWGEELGRQIMYKIPGLRQQLEVSTDIWGNEKEQSNNIVERAFETFIAPYSKTKDISTDLDKEIKRIYGETGETGVIPGVPYGYTRYKNETYRMSAKEYTQYKKTYGQTANSYLDNLIKTDSYKKASYDLKAKMMDKMYDYARAKANEEYFKNTDVKYTSDNLKELNELKDVGITNKSFAEYIADKTQISNIRSSSNYSTEEKRDMVSKIFTSSKLNNKQLSYLYGKYYSTTEKLKALNSLNMPMKEFIKYDLKEFTSDYDSKGKMINGSKQKKVMNYINSLNLSVAQKALLIKLEYNSFKSYDSQIVSYINSSNGDFLDKAYLIKKLGYKSHDKEIIEYVFKHYKTASEREEILKSLGFTIRNGRVY